MNCWSNYAQDILDSEIAYMGYMAAESYGITWKVRGFCKEDL